MGYLFLNEHLEVGLIPLLVMPQKRKGIEAAAGAGDGIASPLAKKQRTDPPSIPPVEDLQSFPSYSVGGKYLEVKYRLWRNHHSQLPAAQSLQSLMILSHKQGREVEEKFSRA